MTEREKALRHAICQEPHDDHVRLIFADWLEEDGRCEQAEFIRAQIKSPGWQSYTSFGEGHVAWTGTDPTTANVGKWTREINDICRSISEDEGMQYVVHRGFVRFIEGPLESITDCFESHIYNLHPVREVIIISEETVSFYKTDDKDRYHVEFELGGEKYKRVYVGEVPHPSSGKFANFFVMWKCQLEKSLSDYFGCATYFKEGRLFKLDLSAIYPGAQEQSQTGWQSQSGDWNWNPLPGPQAKHFGIDFTQDKDAQVQHLHSLFDANAITYEQLQQMAGFEPITNEQLHFGEFPQQKGDEK